MAVSLVVIVASASASTALWAGTLAGVGLCAATLALALGVAAAPHLTRLGVLARRSRRS